MKIEVFVSDPMLDALSSQAETDMNAALAMALQKAASFSEAARSDGTRRVYAKAWRQWSDWATLHRTAIAPANPAAVAAYVAALAHQGQSLSSVNVALSAIQREHRALGTVIDRKHPLIADVLKGISRTLSKPVDRARALDLENLQNLITTLDADDLRSLRDKALILVGFFGALRRSEIASLEIGGRSTMMFTGRGLLLKLSGTKSSLKTEEVAIPRRGDALCPAAALARYLDAAGITSGPLFQAVSKAGRLVNRPLDPSSVRFILRRCMKDAGLDASAFSPHSLRAGFITAAANANVPEHLIQRTSRHKSVDVLRSYIRVADAFEQTAASFL
jgi:integrase